MVTNQDVCVETMIRRLGEFDCQQKYRFSWNDSGRISRRAVAFRSKGGFVVVRMYLNIEDWLADRATKIKRRRNPTDALKIVGEWIMNSR